jgi:hypothetical protein
MEGIVQAFLDGGIWMYLITALAISLVAVGVVQYRRQRERDYTWVLVAILLTIVAVGPLGTLVGIIQAYEALELVAPDKRLALMVQALGIAVTTTTYSALVCAAAAVPLGYLVQLVRGLHRPAQAPVQHEGV